MTNKAKIRTDKTRTVRASSSKVKPKTVNKANRDNRPTSSKVNNLTTKLKMATMTTTATASLTMLTTTMTTTAFQTPLTRTLWITTTMDLTTQKTQTMTVMESTTLKK